MPETILLTGVTGFIAKRIALDLLNAGYSVRGSLRSLERRQEVRDALIPWLGEPARIDALSFVELDLMHDDGWRGAVDGADALVHTASPFPMVQPKDPQDLIRPAVQGTERALHAARNAGVHRVVMTSSVVAIEARDNPEGRAYTEDDWSDPEHPRSTAYYQSKTYAERAAWKIAAEHPELRLTTINPALVLGTPLDAQYGTSLELVERMLRGKDPMVPNIGFGVVDVADVSAMHIAALERPETAGERFIASASSVWLPELARHLAKSFADRRIPTRIAPRPVLGLLSLFDPTIRTILPAVGTKPTFDTRKAKERLGIDFTPWQTATLRAAEAIVAA
ncbi:MAG: NAD-dependent epimerase/dehydratase family protein [Pseudomonadota bacterium]